MYSPSAQIRKTLTPINKGYDSKPSTDYFLQFLYNSISIYLSEKLN